MSVCVLPSNRCRTVLEQIAKKEGFNKYELSATPGFTNGENYLGEIFRVIITGEKDDGKSESLHLIMKVSLKIAKLREDGFIQGIYHREAYVYKTMLPTLYELQKDLPPDERFEFAKLYEAVLEEDEEILVMEDLCHKGYRMLNRMVSFNYEQVVVCVKSLARYHATSFVLKAKQPKLYDEIYANTCDYLKLKDGFGKYVTSSKPYILPVIESEPYEKEIMEVLDCLGEDFHSLFDNDLTDPYCVFIHGDSWSNNLLFRSKNGKTDKMMSVDWQLMRNASPIIDLSYVLLLSIDSKMRSKYYEELLDLYYEVLSSNVTKMGVDMSICYPPSVYRKQLTKYMKFGLTVGFGLLQLTLANKEDAVDNSEAFEHFGEDNIPSVIPISNTCRARMKELFEDCIKFKVI